MAEKITADLRSAPSLDGPWSHETVVRGERIGGGTTSFEWPPIIAKPGHFYRLDNIRTVSEQEAYFRSRFDDQYDPEDYANAEASARPTPAPLGQNTDEVER